MKVYVIFCIPAQIPYFGKSCSWDMGQNALGQSDNRIFKTKSSKENDEIACFLYVDTNTYKSIVLCTLLKMGGFF